MRRRINRLILSATVGLIFLAGCSRSPKSMTLSSGTTNGYYSRLAQQIKTSTDRTVNVEVQDLRSEGSIENLNRLLDRRVDFALVQLDVVSDAMRQGKVQAVAVLANEPIHIIAPKDSKVKTLSDLEGKRVSIGTPGSGIHFTSTALATAFNLDIQKDTSGFDEAFRKLNNRQLDAAIYVGSIGASQRIRQQLVSKPLLQLIPIQPTLVNYLINRDPGSYQAMNIPEGVYSARPTIPDRDIPTLATSTVLVTRPDVPEKTVGLITWSILYNSRQFSSFYPELQTGDARSLLQKNLLYIHPGAQSVYSQNADPREAWLRYLESNNDLQAGLFILLGTSGIGLIIRRWNRDRCKKLLASTITRLNELNQLLPHNAQQALSGVEDLSQEHRLMFIEGSITADTYEQVQHKTQTFSEQCRKTIKQQHKELVLETLLILDDWQAALQIDPESALQKLTYLKQQYREMLIHDQVEIQAYIELMELTLLSVMSLARRNESNPGDEALLSSSQEGFSDATSNAK